jgi:hypothetical protein
VLGPFTTRKINMANIVSECIILPWSNQHDQSVRIFSRCYSFFHHLAQRLGENVRNLLICVFVLGLHCSLVYHVLDQVLQEYFEATQLHDLRH